MFNPEEEILLGLTARFYEDKSAGQGLSTLLRLRKNVDIKAEAFCAAFDQLALLITAPPPDNWPSLGSGVYELVFHARERADLCDALGRSGSLGNAFSLAAGQASSHDRLTICVMLMEAAVSEPSKTWRGILARHDGIPDAFISAAASLTSYDGRPATEFFRLAKGKADWSAALAASGVLKRAIHVCPHQTPIALDILLKAAADTAIRDGMIRSGSIREIYDYVREWRGAVPFQIQCVEPWAHALFPSLRPYSPKTPNIAMEQAAILG